MKLDISMCDNIINFINSDENHERTKREIRKRFNINNNIFTNLLIYMTWNYLLYETDDGKVLGICDIKDEIATDIFIEKCS